MEMEIEIPTQVAERILQYAAETGLPLEEVIETAFRNYMTGDENRACA